MGEETTAIDGDEGKPQRNRAASFIVDQPEYTPDKAAYDHDPQIGQSLEKLESMASKDGILIRGRRTTVWPHTKFEARIDPGTKLAEAVKRFSEAANGAKISMRESFDNGQDYSTGGTGPGSPNNPEAEFLQILGGPFSKQLYLADYLNMHAKCWWEITHNPIARQLVDLKTDYVVGRGVKFQAVDLKFQEVWDAFERREKWQKMLRQHVRDESWQGEGMLRKYVNGNGLLTLRHIDPSTIWEVIANPQDTQDVKGYWQNYSGAYNIVSMGNVPFQTYTVDFIPASDIIHSKLNVSAGEKRGRSDLYPALGWFKRLRDFTAAVVLSGQYAFAYVFDVTIDGDSSDIESVRQNPHFAKVPKPGSSWLHNGAMKVEAMSSKIGTGLSATKEVTTMLLRFAAAAFGIPIEYLGVSEGGTKASAIAKASPFAKHIEILQRHTEDTCHEVKMAVYEAAVAGGIIGKDVSSDGEFTFPEPAPEDVDARLRRLDYLWRSGRITHKRSSLMSVAEANITRYEYEKEMSDIKAEVDAGIDLVAQQLNQRAASLASGDQLDDSTGRMSPGDRANAKADSSSLK